MKHLVVFGDSVATGQYVSAQYAWPVVLARSLEDVRVTIAAVNGDTTRMALLRMHHDVVEPSAIIVQFGINDCHVWDGHQRVSPSAFRANLLEIAARAGCPVVFQTNHACRKTVEHTEANAAYNDIIRGVAAETGAWLTDIERAGAIAMLYDGVHPSEAGQARYAELAYGNAVAALAVAANVVDREELAASIGGTFASWRQP